MRPALVASAGEPDGGDLPALLRMSIASRRWTFLFFAVAIFLGLTMLMTATLAYNGYGWMDLLLTVLFALTLPWVIVGFLNALIGLYILRTTSDPVKAVCAMDIPKPDSTIHGSTAIALSDDDPYGIDPASTFNRDPRGFLHIGEAKVSEVELCTPVL